MKCLLLHCNKFSYETTEPTSVAYGDGKPLTQDFSNTLLVFMTIENNDSHVEVAHALKNFIHESEKLQTKSIVINPFAHLSYDVAKPVKAIEVLGLFRQELNLLKHTQEFVITSFGWNKTFQLDIAGHSHAHMYRHFGKGMSTDGLNNSQDEIEYKNTAMPS